MIANARYAHTNLIARDWRSLASFYEQVFRLRCGPAGASAAQIEAGSGVKGSGLQGGVHLRLPGLGSDGPTLQIFSYGMRREAVRPEIHRPGFDTLLCGSQRGDGAAGGARGRRL